MIDLGKPCDVEAENMTLPTRPTASPTTSKTAMITVFNSTRNNQTTVDNGNLTGKVLSYLCTKIGLMLQLSYKWWY